MSTSKHVMDLGGVAAADYSTTGQYLAVAFTAATSKWTKASVAGQAVQGILQNAPASGAACSVSVLGIAKWECGDTVTALDPLATGANGKCVKKTTDAQYQIAIALEAGVSGRIISVLLVHLGYGGNDAVSRKYLGFSVDAADIANGDVITTFPMNHAGKIMAVYAVCEKAVTTAAKAADINVEIGTTNLTGGVVSLTGTYALGAVVAGSAVTAANEFAATDTISIEASSVTAFVEGRFKIVVEYI
jgi:hypothetical protein